MIELKDKVLLTESTKSIWRTNRGSKEWIDANTLYKFLFGVNLGSPKCECLEDLFQFIKSKNINSKIKNKMEKQFILIPGKVLQTSIFGVITSNSSDEQCIKLLTAYPALSKHFKTLPKDWEEVCNGEDVTESEDENESVDSASSENEPKGDVQEDENESVDLDKMKTPDLIEYIKSKGSEAPKGKKAEILEFAKTL